MTTLNERPRPVPEATSRDDKENSEMANDESATQRFREATARLNACAEGLTELLETMSGHRNRGAIVVVGPEEGSTVTPTSEAFVEAISRAVRVLGIEVECRGLATSALLVIAPPEEVSWVSVVLDVGDDEWKLVADERWETIPGYRLTEVAPNGS